MSDATRSKPSSLPVIVATATTTLAVFVTLAALTGRLTPPAAPDGAADVSTAAAAAVPALEASAASGLDPAAPSAEPSSFEGEALGGGSAGAAWPEEEAPEVTARVSAGHDEHDDELEHDDDELEHDDDELEHDDDELEYGDDEHDDDDDEHEYGEHDDDDRWERAFATRRGGRRWGVDDDD